MPTPSRAPPAVRRIRSLTLRGRKWRVRWLPRIVNKEVGKQSLLGLCHHKRKTLYFASRQSATELPDTLIHEILHSLWPHANERRIAEAAGDLVRALERLGLLSPIKEKP